MKYTLDINTERTISEHVLRYSATLLDSNHYLVEGFSKSDNKYKVLLKLPLGLHELMFDDAKITVEYKLDEKCLQNSGVRVYYLQLASDNSLEHVYNFLEKCRIHSLNYKSDKVTCRVMKKGFWSELSSLPKRNIESVILNNNDRDDIMDDITRFIDSEEEYLEKGIPYKRNYLLEGLPGTGKTSLIFAIASHLDMDLCIINFSNHLDDINFMDAVSNMNDKSILVLEDIDCVFGGRNGETVKTGISFGGILNVLDGIGRKHKLITFMTTNYIKTLDEALLRAGRIDYKLNFDYSNVAQTKHLYNKLINNIKEGDCNLFIEKIHNYKYTPAILQKYLFKHRDNSIEKILKDITEFANMCNEHNDRTSGVLYM